MNTNIQEQNRFYDELVNAIATWKIATDELLETAALKQIIKTCEKRLNNIKPDAVALAEVELALGDPERESGRFTYKDLTFELGLTYIYDFVKNPSKYRTPEAINYRTLANEQADLRTQLQAKTKEMSTIATNYRAAHPKSKPDKIQKVLKFIDD